MNNFQTAAAFLKILSQNLRILHRNLADCPSWFGNHELLGEYYEKADEITDALIEAGLSLGYDEPNIKDAVLLFSEKVTTAEAREIRDTLGIVAEQFREAVALLGLAKDDAPDFIKNKIEEYQFYFALEANYKIRHALGEIRTSEKRGEDEE